MNAPHLNRRARMGIGTLAALALAVTGGCTAPRQQVSYTPRVRDVTITAVPLLTKELEGVYPFLKESFGPGGVMEGEEVYAFMPSTVTVVAGDTIHFHLLNPEDDEHAFVVMDLEVAMPGESSTDTTLVVERPGIFRIACTTPGHLPAMWGQLVVLAPSAVESAAGPA